MTPTTEMIQNFLHIVDYCNTESCTWGKYSPQCSQQYEENSSSSYLVWLAIDPLPLAFYYKKSGEGDKDLADLTTIVHTDHLAIIMQEYS